MVVTVGISKVVFKLISKGRKVVSSLVCTLPRHLELALKPIYKELACVGSACVFHVRKLCVAQGWSSIKFAEE